MLNLKTISVYSILLVLLGKDVSASATRRHFLIAYDVSTPFIKAENSIYEFETALIKIFQGNAVSGFIEGNEETLKTERESGYTFFDPAKDDISFFHFNIARSEFSHLQWTASMGEKGVVSEFNKAFIKKKGSVWQQYARSNPNAGVDGYLANKLSIIPSPVEFGRGVSMSNFVYPLVLNHLDSSQYAEEYILIILSDFLTGASFGNTRDLDRVKDIYRVEYYKRLSSSSPVSYIKNHIDQLAAKFYKVDYFQYSFVPRTTSNPIGIIAYKIKPKVGIRSPEDITLFVDGDLGLKQRGYESATFFTTDASIKFTHNNHLNVDEVLMSVVGDKGDVFFQDLIASKSKGFWKSDYTSDEDLMQFDSASLTYRIPSLRMEMDDAINKKDFAQVSFLYQFKTSYSSAHAAPLGYLYTAERTLPLASISYATKTTIIIMTYALPALLLLAIIIWLIYRGRPKAIGLTVNGYLDSFEKVDFKTVGKLLTPFVAWDKVPDKQDYIQVNGDLAYLKNKFIFNWGVDIVISLTALEVPKGFELFMQHKPNDGREYSSGHQFATKKDEKNQFHFVVGIRQTDLNIKLDEPRLIRFSVDADVERSILFAKAKLSRSEEYCFQLGEDLGHVWVGIDPGTTGSCMAVGSTANNIALAKDSDGESVVPSMLTFDISRKPEKGLVAKRDYYYGAGAKALAGSGSYYRSFSSLKKLLGFKDTHEITFKNGKTWGFNGRDLASLLVKNVYRDAQEYFKRDEFQTPEYQIKGEFNPKRAVVAVPNNFTLTKVQDMVDSIKSIGGPLGLVNESRQFKEVRYISEAEAVLFYHLSNVGGGKSSSSAIGKASQSILIFDMGGATINATIATVKLEHENAETKHKVDILAKIGYGIGGDTIDYCLGEFILRFKEEFEELEQEEVKSNIKGLKDMAFEIKSRFVSNASSKDYLMTAMELQEAINKSLGLSTRIPTESGADTEKLYSYFMKSNDSFRVLSKSFIDYLIYGNVAEVVNEVIGLAKGIVLDKVIFSGRSTAFPMIKETVWSEIGKSQKNDQLEKIQFGLDESKTAVAMGACWYGIHEGIVSISKLKAGSTFGFTKTMSPNRKDVKFYPLIGMDEPFVSSTTAPPFINKVMGYKDRFGFDGKKVQFYQVMGANAGEIIAGEQKHKYTRIASIDLTKPSSQIGIQLNEDDSSECVVKLEPTGTIRETGLVADQEIKEANQEHYTWSTNEY